MNIAERYLLEKTAGADVQADIRKIEKQLSKPAPKAYNRRSGTASGNNSITAKLGRYRSLRLRKNRLDLEIKERLAFLKRAQAQENVKPSWFSFGRERNGILDMIRASAELGEKLSECEKYLGIKDQILREALRVRYFDMSQLRMPDWKKTADLAGFCGSPDKLRNLLVAELAKSRTLW